MIKIYFKQILKKNKFYIIIYCLIETFGGRVFLSEESKAFHAHPLQKNIMQLLEELKIQPIPKSSTEAQNIIFLTKRGPFHKLSSFVAAQVYNFFISVFKNYQS